MRDAEEREECVAIGDGCWGGWRLDAPGRTADLGEP